MLKKWFKPETPLGFFKMAHWGSYNKDISYELKVSPLYKFTDDDFDDLIDWLELALKQLKRWKETIKEYRDTETNNSQPQSEEG